jgi:intracellular sulfur oxidation DsrE/DsrF family protein
MLNFMLIRRIVMIRTIALLVGMWIVLFIPVRPFAAQEYQNTEVLKGLSTVKVYFDVKTGSPGKLAAQLSFINDTYDQIIQAGVQPEFIVAFRGKASNFVTKKNDYVFDDEMDGKKKVQAWVSRLKKRGLAMEQCLLSAHIRDIDPEDFLSHLKIIKNSYVSMIAYQAHGYSQITMD